MLPYLTDWYDEELKKFEETDEYKTLRAPFQDLKKNVSQQIGEQITFKKLAFMTIGMDLVVSK